MANKEGKTLKQLKEEFEQAQKAYNDKKEELARKEAEEAKRKMAQLESEKAKRREEIEKAKKHYLDLIQQYIKDYGKFEFDYSYSEDDNLLSFLFSGKPFKFFI